MPDRDLKIKLLKMYDLLRTETDVDHPISRNELCARMNEMGIPCNVQVVARDIKTLNDNGYEVLSYFRNREKCYYVPETDFSVPELKIMIDAMQAASFVTEKKTAELIDKIAKLGGRHREEILKSNLVWFNTRKHSNESVYYIVEALEEIILNKQRASFAYFDFDETGKKVLRHDGTRYVVQPIALVYHEDNYYLLCYDPKTEDKKKTFRIDRMVSVSAEDKLITKAAINSIKDIPNYTKHVFKMFGGKETEVVLEFEKSLVNAVMDKFGEDVVMTASGDRLNATVMVQTSPTFYGWVFQFRGLMDIIFPNNLREEYKNMMS